MTRLLVKRVLLRGLLAVLLVFAVSACEGEGEERSKPRPLPEDSQVLRPGEYRSEEFEPSLSFRVGEGWTNLPLEASDTLFLTRGEEGGLGFTNIQEVYQPTSTGTPKVVEAPKDMVGWFLRHPHLRTDEPEPVTVGGVKGVRFDVVVEDVPEDFSGMCDSDCVDIFRESGGGWRALREEDKFRFIILEDVKGETVTIGFGSPPGEFDEHAREAQEVIDTVEWRSS